MKPYPQPRRRANLCASSQPQHVRTSGRASASSLLLLVLFLALAPTALASSKWYVDGVHGKNKNDCKSPQTACKTIGHAISLASSGDSIMVAAATYTENVTIRFSLKVIGSGARTTIVDGGFVSRVFTIVNANAHVAWSKLTIQHGQAGFGGGGINSGGSTLTINRCFIHNNVSTGACFPKCVPGSGGGIANGGTLTINNNSTISTGGISNAPESTALLQNSIVANSSVGNCSGTITSKGYNLSSDKTCNFNNTGDLNNTDPKLGQLGYYGGPTQTMPLLSGSPAIDAGNPSGCTNGNGHLLKTDQRGFLRPDKEDTGGCDMGAYERQKD
jgi:hypothetical protein